MIKKAIVIVSFLGVAAFVVKNIYFEIPKKIPQKAAILSYQKTGKEPELFRGQFKGMDSIHNVVGDAVIITTSQGPALRFEKFSSTPGPDLVVYLSKNENTIFTKEIGTDYVTLGGLQKLSGEQTYTLPLNIKDYKSVIIWSRAFSIMFGAAPIK